MQRDDIAKLAELARLELTEDEQTQLTTELSSIVAYVDQLNQVDVGKLEPTSQVTGLMNVLRPDEPKSHTEQELLDRREHFLAAAPETERGHVKVPGVFAEDEA